jgi:hypothetical protein
MQNSAAKKRGKERSPTPKAGRFFEAQLPGEDGLSNRTAGKLFDLANEICYRKPWKDMGDADLVLVKDPKSREMCYCQILG